MRKTSKFVVAVLLGHIQLAEALPHVDRGLPWEDTLGFGW